MRLLTFLFLLLFPVSAEAAYAADTVTVSFYCEETLLEETDVPIGAEISLLDYASVRVLMENRGKPLSEGVVYAWFEGETPKTSFVAEHNAVLVYRATEVDAVRSVTYRYDIGEYARSETIEYPYGSTCQPPETVCGKAVYSDLYKTAEYKALDNNEITLPLYLTENLTVYVRTEEPATVTVDGEEKQYEYGTKIGKPSARACYGFVGYYYDEERTQEYSGVARNGLVLYTAWKRTGYKVKAVTPDGEKEIIVGVGAHNLTEKSLPKNYTWTYENLPVTFPATVENDDVVLNGTPKGTTIGSTTETIGTEGKKRLSKDETVAVIVMSIAIAVAAVWVFQARFSKKHRNGNEKDREKEPEKKE